MAASISNSSSAATAGPSLLGEASERTGASSSSAKFAPPAAAGSRSLDGDSSMRSVCVAAARIFDDEVDLDVVPSACLVDRRLPGGCAFDDLGMRMISEARFDDEDTAMRTGRFDDLLSETRSSTRARPRAPVSCAKRSEDSGAAGAGAAGDAKSEPAFFPRLRVPLAGEVTYRALSLRAAKRGHLSLLARGATGGGSRSAAPRRVRVHRRDARSRPRCARPRCGDVCLVAGRWHGSDGGPRSASCPAPRRGTERVFVGTLRGGGGGGEASRRIGRVVSAGESERRSGGEPAPRAARRLARLRSCAPIATAGS